MNHTKCGQGMNHTKCGQGTMYFVTTVWIVPIQVQPPTERFREYLQYCRSQLEHHDGIRGELQESRVGDIRNLVCQLTYKNTIQVTKYIPCGAAKA